MVMSDRIALLRMGELEQVASPREIYSRPATAYTAQFIGHTNLLRGEVKAGVARCHSLHWPVSLPDGHILFSLRPENVRIADSASGNFSANVVRLRGQVRQRGFHGSTELLRIECADGLNLSVRTAARDHWQDDLELEFSPEDAVPVRKSDETA
jgi:ABC-type Fe3+/spermidine/putrescine transport system ATPase subunit